MVYARFGALRSLSAWRVRSVDRHRDIYLWGRFLRTVCSPVNH